MKYLKQLSFVFTGLLILLLAACTVQATQPPEAGAQPTQPDMTALPETGEQPTQALLETPASAGENPLANTVWKLESIDKAGTPFPAVSRVQATLQFDDQGQASGSSGCNSYGGRYQVAGSTITFSDLVSTLMACEDQEVMDLEARFLEALQTAKSFTLDAGTLSISFGEDQGSLNFIPAETGTATPPA